MWASISRFFGKFLRVDLDGFSPLIRLRVVEVNDHKYVPAEGFIPRGFDFEKEGPTRT